jgi:hypothetical protein
MSILAGVIFEDGQGGCAAGDAPALACRVQA